MSKGVIVRHLGESKYVVSLEYAIERVQQELAQIEDRITELAVKIPEEKVQLIEAQRAVESKTRDIDLLIPDFNDGVEGSLGLITTLQADAVRLQAVVRKIELSLAELVSEDLSLKKRRGQLNAVASQKRVEAWCADYNEELTGNVGLIDINDEGGKGIVIQPGFEGAAEYSPDRDGALFPDAAQSARQIFFNSAVLAGVQKWMPKYRVGTILSIDGDTCSVQLDDAKSSAQNLPINQRSSLANVPIMYMDCNGQAFEESDRVVVRFTQSGPLIVGFEKEPRDCGLDIYIMDPERGILRMSPDMRTIKESIAPSDPRLRDFAITDEKLMIVYERPSTYSEPGSTNELYDDSLIIFGDSGAQITNQFEEPTFQIRQIAGATSENFLLYLNDGANESSFVEVYDFNGGFVKSIDVSTPDLDFSIYSQYHVPANDDYVLHGSLLIGEDFSISKTALDTGFRAARYDVFQNWNTRSWATKNRIYIPRVGPFSSEIDIYDNDGGFVGVWNLVTRITPRTFTVVTRSRGYAFTFDPFSNTEDPGFSEVAVYKRSGDTFSLIEVVDMRAQHGLNFIPKAMPDTRKLLALDA